MQYCKLLASVLLDQYANYFDSVEVTKSESHK